MRSAMALTVRRMLLQLYKVPDKAKADGGGIVYLPGGRYKMLGTLTVPTGVELRGAADFGMYSRGHGTHF